MTHKLSDVQSLNLGEDTTIWQYCVILKNAKIGNNVTIKSGVQIWDGITIEDDVFIGPNVTFTNDFTPRSKQYPTQFLKTIIKKGASIGANSTILGGITIGEHSMIGAGSVVTKNIGIQELWYGNPANNQGYVCKCGQKCDELLVCSTCLMGGGK